MATYDKRTQEEMASAKYKDLQLLRPGFFDFGGNPFMGLAEIEYIDGTKEECADVMAFVQGGVFLNLWENDPNTNGGLRTAGIKFVPLHQIKKIYHDFASKPWAFEEAEITGYGK